MARLEKNVNANPNVVVEVRHSAAGKSHRLLRALFPLFVLGSIAFGIAWLAAETGFANIPFITPFAFQTPRPVREVKPEKPVDVFVGETVVAETRRRLAVDGTLSDGRIAFSIPEGSLTASLQAMVPNLPQLPFDASRSQVAVDPAGMELFLPLKNQALNTALRVVIVPGTVDGLLTLDVKDVWIGTLKVPHALAKPLFGNMLLRALGPFIQDIGRYAKLSSVVSETGALSIEGETSVQIVPLPASPL